nr:E2 [Papillomaviridae sp.]
MNLYENATNDLETQIQHWELTRQEHIILYYARQQGLKRLGLHPVPSLATSEHKAKEAIKMTLYLRSLQESPFGNEPWSLTETSLELFNTPPSNCFKKQGYTVDVLYDRDPDKLYPYTGWHHIYFQGEDNLWHKTEGHVDYYGLYYYDDFGDKVYYIKFDEKAKTLSETGEWEVKFQNKTISPSVTSSSSSAWKPTSSPGPRSSRHTETREETYRRSEEDPQSGPGTNKTPTAVRYSRGRRERESGSSGRSPAKRRRTATPDSTGSAVPTPDQVGSSHRSVGREHSSRLERLQAEARDPPILIVKGCANTLKCWRYRFKVKNSKLFLYASTVFKWVDLDADSRMLLAFKDENQRTLFVNSVTLPKGTQIAYGSLNSL